MVGLGLTNFNVANDFEIIDLVRFIF